MTIRLLLAVLAAINFAAGASAQTPEQVAKATEGFKVCASRFPETRGTRAMLLEQGWEYGGTEGNIHVFWSNNRRILIGTGATGAYTQTCLLSISRMRDKAAAQLAASFGAAFGLKRMQTSELPLGEGWFGRINGRDVVITALPSEDFMFLKGAIVILAEAALEN